MLRIRLIAPAAILSALLAGFLLFSPRDAGEWATASAQGASPSPGSQFFLKIDGVDGEATETDHGGELALRSFSWSETKNLDTSSRVQTKDFHASMAFEKSSPVLMRKTAVRERIAKAVLTARNGNGQDYLKWTMTDVILTGFQVEGTWGTGRPTASFDMNVGKMDLEYRPQLYNGGLGPATKTGWEAK